MLPRFNHPVARRATNAALQSRNKLASSSVVPRAQHSTTPEETPGKKKKGQRKISFFGPYRFPEFLDHWGPDSFYKTGAALSVGAASSFAIAGCGSAVPYLITAPVLGYWALGMKDLSQNQHAIRKNFPVLGNFRYFLENLGPEIRQYLIEADHDEKPYNREDRSLVYRRSKLEALHSMPFGTRKNVEDPGYEWINHSLFPTTVDPKQERITIGGPHCTKPYSASRLNISGMSYGALSRNAVLALNDGAKQGNFYHNTGEGGLTSHHLEMGGDVVWNIGTGYFGCRTMDGKFSETEYMKRATLENVKMIEVKLSQGAKPGHGGMLPKDKVSQEISEIRIVPMGKDCLSPPFHTAFDKTPLGLLQFVDKLRKLSGGKPTGIKMCVGRPDEVVALVQAMVEHNITPDFITIDGGEGGTGAAPVEFSNSVGTPMLEGLHLIVSLLQGAGLKEQVTVITSGKILTGFSMVRAFAMGADACNSARAFLFSLGCIQALKCNSNKCPTGITTSDPVLMKGLDVTDKADRVFRYHANTVHVAMELIGASGLDNPSKLRPEHIMKRISRTSVMSYKELYAPVESGAFLRGQGPEKLQAMWNDAAKAAKQ